MLQLGTSFGTIKPPLSNGMTIKEHHAINASQYLVSGSLLTLVFGINGVTSFLLLMGLASIAMSLLAPK